jgi:hypothetical protein
MLGARKSETSGNKRDRAEASQDTDLMEEDPALAEQMLSDINKDFQFPRLLSSRKLLDLEVGKRLSQITAKKQPLINIKQIRWKMLDLEEMSLYNTWCYFNIFLDLHKKKSKK